MKITYHNLPNALTLLRILIIPIFIACALSHHEIYALFLFIIAAITDGLDGMLARRMNNVSAFGKLFDPLADKLLVLAALCLFSYWHLIGWWITALIFLRESFVTMIREYYKNRGTYLAAKLLGKIKTILQMSLIIGTFAYRIWIESSPIVDNVIVLFFIFLVVVTWLSAWDYLKLLGCKNEKNS